MDTSPDDIAVALAAEQDQVGALLDRLTDAGWDEPLNPLALDRLLILGHFPEYAAELDWTPREIAGHLRDSARVFTERIGRILDEDEPTLPDFVTDDPVRLRDYAATSREELREELTTAQLALREAVAGVPAAALGRRGVHEADGPLLLGELLAFLPEHQRDHREQLAAFAAAPF
ncbi:MAG: DinB family protein [Actinobacteria bacterium]|nr:DinB family protein [Actinomycetota bacterium]